ncbi:MAG: WXG100 family type VII secretion target [Defluviitaleaceae bacterium]|nr:WXG100 family type VII secretion target [Defluviitaleaceae bacterium]
MPTPNGIRDMSNTVRANRAAVSSKNSTYDRSASSVATAWKGDAGEAYKDAYRRAKAQMTATLSNYNSLSSKLNSLANAVKRAEDEEKRANRRVACPTH